MKLFTVVLAILLCCAAASVAQIVADGPASGSITGGVTVNTNNFGALDTPWGEGGPLQKPVRNKVDPPPQPMPPNMPAPLAPEGSNYHEYLPEGDSPTGPPPIVIRSFDGIPQTNNIPPDPHVAVGPNHVIQVVNTIFRITDKAGTTLKTIGADQWFQSALPNPGAFDPKVHYDHFANRWLMVWLHQNSTAQTAYYLVSVSDDSDPIGVWYNWAIPSNTQGGTTVAQWADYQGVGFDSLAYYFTSNMFGFSSGYFGVKARILPKAQFLLNNAGPITWTDFWNVRDLFGNDTFGTRPSVKYGQSSDYYLVGKPNFTGGSYFVVYRITNPVTSPAITAVHVPVTSWTNAPNADQLGGSTIRLEGGSSAIRCEPVWRNNSLWWTHSIASGGGTYSAARYVRLNTTNNAVLEDGSLGALGYWHIYPALEVDRDGNAALTFSRSGVSEYVGAYMSWRFSGDAPGVLRPAVEIQAGRGNYVKDFGSGRNRWGDYMGIKLDPTDQYTFWSLTEYASAVNTWSVWVHAARLAPFAGVRINVTQSSRNFGIVEVGRRSDTTTVYVYNVGTNSLTVNSIAKSSAAYTLLDLPSFPRTLATFDSIRFRVFFAPTAHGTVNDTIRIASNDPVTPTSTVALTAKGIQIGRAQVGTMYAASNGRLHRINISTGAATDIGSLGISDIHGLAVHPVTRELWGTRSSASSTEFYRIASAFGDALYAYTVPAPNVRGIAFINADTLFGASTTSRLYRIVAATRDTIGVGSASPALSYSAIALHPVTGELWASVRPAISGRDRIYTLDKGNGAATLIGATGFGTVTAGIAFTKNGSLYGVTNTGSTINNFISIRTDSAIGTLIGPTGVSGLNAIVTRTDSTLTGIDDPVSAEIPVAYALDQNYPNPFNPATSIRYAVPAESRVTLTVHTLLGQEIARLVDGVQSAGQHTAVWDGRTATGAAASSGVYLYRVEAGSFRAVRKMLLMK